MSCAGVRQLLEDKMNDLVDYIYSLLNDSAVNPFHTASPMSARALSGEEEGVFEWITVNYLLGSFAGLSNACLSFCVFLLVILLGHFVRRQLKS